MTAFSAASLPANDAQAGEPPRTASAPVGAITKEQGLAVVKKMHEMQDYSKDPATKGVGVFINLQAGGTPEDGDKIGGILKNAFASKGIPLEYRINQSRGTATDITFYVKGFDFTMALGQLKGSLGKILAHHRDLWPPKAAER